MTPLGILRRINRANQIYSSAKPWTLHVLYEEQNWSLAYRIWFPRKWKNWDQVQFTSTLLALLVKNHAGRSKVVPLGISYEVQSVCKRPRSFPTEDPPARIQSWRILAGNNFFTKNLRSSKSISTYFDVLYLFCSLKVDSLQVEQIILRIGFDGSWLMGRPILERWARGQPGRRSNLLNGDCSS
jgi:hypothetical protein